MNKPYWVIHAIFSVANLAFFCVMLIEGNDLVAIINFGVGLASLVVAFNGYANWEHYRTWSKR